MNEILKNQTSEKLSAKEQIALLKEQTEILRKKLLDLAIKK